MTLASGNNLAGRRVLVTGGSGFIGSHLVRRLLGEGADVSVIIPAVSTTVSPRLADVWADIRVVEANLTDRSAMEYVAAEVRPEFVAHLAAYTHVGKSFIRFDESVATNIQGTLNLLHALRGSFERFVFTGTSEIYGDVPPPFSEQTPVNPVSPYSVSKYSAERFCLMLHQAFGWPIVCLRPFTLQCVWSLAISRPGHSRNHPDSPTTGWAQDDRRSSDARVQLRRRLS
jgi:UDP-glucose 4-epimerase